MQASKAIEWQRPKTTRMYLHPPKSERIFTLWREGKIMLGEIEAPINKEYSDINASGILFLDENGNAADFRKNEFSVNPMGIPNHKLSCEYGELILSLECVCDFSRLTTCYIKANLRSKSGARVVQKFAVVLRSGKEERLISGAPDLYCDYSVDAKSWLDIESGWRDSCGVWRDGEVFVAADKPEMFSFDERNGIAWTDIDIKGDECVSFTLAFGKGDYKAQKFEDVYEQSLAFWNRELARLTKLPKAITEDENKLRIVSNLTVQLLQCFCYSVGGTELYSRQGGLQRRVWTYEAMPVLEALAKLGDFDDYIEPVIDVYFNRFYTECGEIVPLGIHWAMATATVLNSFGKYAVTRGKEYYLKYRDKAIRSFDWIRVMRTAKSYNGTGKAEYEKTLDTECELLDGLFPPMSCCDDPLVFQAWLSTDSLNIIGIRGFLEACEKYSDARAQDVRAEYESYLSVIRAAFDKLMKESDGDELEIPISLSSNNKEVSEKFEFAASLGALAETLMLVPEEYEKIINFYERRGFIKGGLFNKMPDRACAGAPFAFLDENGKSPIWYVCGQEHSWFNCFKQSADYERCKLIIEDNLKYAMTDEFYMIERYNQKNEWYAPWSPNASCNGRMLNMLLDFGA